jgi:phosphatidylglycerophosphatase A
MNLKVKIAEFLASGFYVGKIPFAPGTVGTLVAIPIMFLYWQKGVGAQFLITLSVFFIGLWASTVVVGDTNGREKNEIDPDFVVIDEIAGYMVSMIAVPFEPLYLAIAFVLFRIYDIVKPPPVKWFESLPSGLGIMADDIAAGVYVLIIMHILIHFFKI